MGRVTKKRGAIAPTNRNTPSSIQSNSPLKKPSSRRPHPRSKREASENYWISWRRTLLLSSISVCLGAMCWYYVHNIRNNSSTSTPPIQNDARRVTPLAELDESEVPSHQKASYFKPYTVDLRELMREREEKMKLYNFNYSLTGVDRRSDLSLQEFWDVYDGKWPVILTDVVPKWSAFNWSREFLFENYGKERVTMKAVDELSLQNISYPANNGRQSHYIDCLKQVLQQEVFDQIIPELLPEVYPFTAVYDFELQHSGFKKNSLDQAVSLALPLELFYKNTHKAYPNRWTYVEDELFIPTRPQLKKDIGHCDHLEEDFYQLFPDEVRPWNAMLLWGTQFSRSSLHIDPYNWTGTNAVLKGRKKWKLFPPGQDHLLYVMRGRKSGFPLNSYKYNSPVDAYDIDMLSYPVFTTTQQVEFEQLPGELLIIPTGWFHQAFNMEETIAISSQVMNRNNFRVVLEEIIKAGNVKRFQFPPYIDDLSPVDQVRTVMSLLPQEILDRGRHVTADALYQIEHGYKDRQYQLPLDD